jgi:hypothetical protein
MQKIGAKLIDPLIIEQSLSGITLNKQHHIHKFAWGKNEKRFNSSSHFNNSSNNHFIANPTFDDTIFNYRQTAVQA